MDGLDAKGNSIPILVLGNKIDRPSASEPMLRQLLGLRYLCTGKVRLSCLAHAGLIFTAHTHELIPHHTHRGHVR
jgi:hypothetical protein